MAKMYRANCYNNEIVEVEVERETPKKVVIVQPYGKMTYLKDGDYVFFRHTREEAKESLSSYWNNELDYFKRRLKEAEEKLNSIHCL